MVAIQPIGPILNCNYSNIHLYKILYSMKKKNFKVLFSTTIILIAVLSCREDNKPINIQDTSNPNYAYFPESNGSQWVFEETTYNGAGKLIDSVVKTGIYYKDSGGIVNYVNGKPWSYQFWYNTPQGITCCGGKLLLDFAQLNCTSDSVLIHHDTSNGKQQYTWQFCKSVKITSKYGYDILPTIRTAMYSTNSNKTGFKYFRYYAKNIGLVQEESIFTDMNGKITKKGFMKLKSHKIL